MCDLWRHIPAVVIVNIHQIECFKLLQFQCQHVPIHYVCRGHTSCTEGHLTYSEGHMTYAKGHLPAQSTSSHLACELHVKNLLSTKPYLVVVFKPRSHGNHSEIHSKRARQVGSCRYVHPTAAQQKHRRPQGNIGAILAVHSPCTRRGENGLLLECNAQSDNSFHIYIGKLWLQLLLVLLLNITCKSTPHTVHTLLPRKP